MSQIRRLPVAHPSATLPHPTVSRRTFLVRSAAIAGGTFLPSVLAGCRSTPARGPEGAGSAYAAMLPWLHLHYGVAESRFVSERCVVVLADAHIPQVVEGNLARVREIEAQFDLQLLGVENYIDRPQGKADQQSVQTLTDVFQLNRATESQVDGLGYPKYFDRTEFQTIGLEDGELYTLNQVLVTHSLFFYVLLKLAQNPAVLDKDGYPKDFPFKGGYLTTIRGTERALAKAGLLLTPFQPDLLPARTPNGDLDLRNISEKGLKHLEDLMLLFKKAAQLGMVGSRNRIAAEKIATAMKTGQFTRAAIVVGAAHLDESMAGVTLQTYLVQKGLSFIIVKLPPGVPDAIRKTLNPKLL